VGIAAAVSTRPKGVVKELRGRMGRPRSLGLARPVRRELSQAGHGRREELHQGACGRALSMLGAKTAVRGETARLHPGAQRQACLVEAR